MGFGKMMCGKSKLFNKHCTIPVLFRVVSVFKSEDGQAHLTHRLKNVNPHTMKGGPCHFYVSARQVALSSAGFTQSAIRERKGKIIAVMKGLAFKFERYLLRKLFVVSVHNHSPLVARKHFFEFAHAGVAGP